MRRTVATIALVLGLVVAAFTITGWWVWRTAFATTRTEHLASHILEDPVLRDDLARRISEQVAPQLGTDPATVRRVVETALIRPEVASVFSGVVGDIHARLIGLRTDPIIIGPELLTAATGDGRAASLPPVSIVVPQIDQLNTARRDLDRYLGQGALAAVALIAFGLALHPWRAAAVGIIGVGCLATAILLVTVGYFVPVRAVPSLTDEPWLAVVPDVARDQQAVLIAMTVLLVGTGILSLFGAGLLARRPVTR